MDWTATLEETLNGCRSDYAPGYKKRVRSPTKGSGAAMQLIAAYLRRP